MPADRTLLAPSGIGPVDAAWGGFARPGAYLLVGSAKNGRLHLAAQAAGGAPAEGARALVFSTRAPAAVAALARQAGVDLAGAYARGLAKLLRVPAAAELAALGDDGLRQALADLAGAVGAHEAARVVVEDFTPFVQFRTFDAFAAAFGELLGATSALGATLVLGLGEPANEGSRRLLTFTQGEATGALHVGRAADGSGQLTLAPGKGHAGVAPTVAWSPDGSTPPPPVRRSLFTEASLAEAAPAEPPRAEAPLARAAAEEVRSPPPFAAAPFPAGPDDPFGPEPDAYAHSADGYAGEHPEALDPAAFIVSAPAAAVHPVAPPPPAAPPPPTAPPEAPGPFGPDTFAVDPLAPDGFAPDATAPDPEDAADDTEWATVESVPLDDPAGPQPPIPGADLLSVGFLVDSHVDGEPLPEGVPAAPPAPVPPALAAPAFAPLGDGADADDDGGDPEEAFRLDLAAAFATREQAPFLAMAVRLDASSPYVSAFSAVADGLLGALTSTDRALVRDDTARLLALLPGAEPDAPQRLFGAVRAHLEHLLGAEAEPALRAVGVLVVPNGQPFTTPEELMAYAMG